MNWIKNFIDRSIYSYSNHWECINEKENQCLYIWYFFLLCHHIFMQVMLFNFCFFFCFLYGVFVVSFNRMQSKANKRKGTTHFSIGIFIINHVWRMLISLIFFFLLLNENICFENYYVQYEKWCWIIDENTTSAHKQRWFHREKKFIFIVHLYILARYGLRLHCIRNKFIYLEQIWYVV